MVISDAFALAQSGIIDVVPGGKFTGSSFTGLRYRCLDGGSVRTGTGNKNVIPGTIAGTTTYGGAVSGFYS